MKLINCKIDGFGKFAGNEVRFKDGLNIFCCENGWGKTTIAAFVRAMLYGLPPERANARETGERARFRPFEGSAFGGSLELEVGGHNYIIRRTFDAKKGSRDGVEVYEDGKPAPRLLSDPGAGILGIDGDTFDRVLFAGCDDTETGSTGDIEARLNAYTQGDASADDAIKKLDAERRKLLPDRGNGGLINAQRALCEGIRADIYAAERKSQMLDGLYAERTSLAAQAAALDEELKRAGSAESAKVRRQAYERYTQDAARERAAAQAIASSYPAGLPDERDIEGIRAKIADLRAGQRSAAAPAASAERLKRTFAEPPSEKQLAACRENIKRRRKKAEKRGSADSYVWSSLAALCLIICGAVLLPSTETAGIVLLAAGAVFALIAAAGAIKRFLTVREVRQALAKYGYEDEDSLLDDWKAYVNLATDMKSAQSGLDGIYAAINAFFAKYMPDRKGQPEELLYTLSTDRAELLRHENMQRELERRAAEYADSKDFNPDGSGTEELLKRLSALNARISAQDGRIDECEQFAARLSELRARLDAETEKLHEQERFHSAIVKVIAYIRAADDSIKDRFSTPVSAAFRKYLKRSQASLGKDAELDGDLRITFDGGGIPRGDDFLSSGQRAVSALCFRLALCDCIFGGEKPFVILDDPFAYLDERRIAACVRVLEALAADRQIIYFTCHPSRAPQPQRY